MGRKPLRPCIHLHISPVHFADALCYDTLHAHLLSPHSATVPPTIPKVNPLRLQNVSYHQVIKIIQIL